MSSKPYKLCPAATLLQRVILHWRIVIRTDPTKISSDIIDNRNIAVAIMHTASVNTNFLDANGNFLWPKQVAITGLSDLVFSALGN